MYAYVRLCSIKRKINTIDIKNIVVQNILHLNEKIESDLVIHLLQYNTILEKTANELNPNILTLYLYELSEYFHAFFHKCTVINSQYMGSRIMICELTRRILKNGLNLLGLTLLNKM